MRLDRLRVAARTQHNLCQSFSPLPTELLVANSDLRAASILGRLSEPQEIGEGRSEPAQFQQHP